MSEDIEKEEKHTEEHHAAEEQGIEEEKTSEEKKEEMARGERDEDPLTKEGQEEMVENDEIEPWEAGFAEGASQEGQHAKDALTGESLMGVDDVVEAEIDGKIYRFVSEENAQKFREKMKS
tara:strand:- start:708 stop:1070 length:363 start_codon:yes stop_codon:yes gene_type:complete